MSLVIWSVIIIVLDQLSKYWVRSNLAGKDAVVIIKDFFYLNYVENKGAAFGFLNDSELGSIFLKIFSLILTIGLIFLGAKLKHRRLRFALATIIAGSIGNLLDRFILSFVTDFLSFHFGPYIFPSFNIADSCIVLGVFYFAFLIIFDKEADESLTAVLEKN